MVVYVCARLHHLNACNIMSNIIFRNKNKSAWTVLFTVYNAHNYVPVCAWELLDLHKSRQGNTTNLNISFSMEKEIELLRRDLNPRHTAFMHGQLKCIQ